MADGLRNDEVVGGLLACFPPQARFESYPGTDLSFLPQMPFGQ